MLLPIMNNNNVYPRVDNKCGGGSCDILPGYGYWCETVVPENTIFRRNNYPNSKTSILLSLHIGGTT